MKVRIGIDPGINGAIAWAQDTIINRIAMPRVAERADPGEIYSILKTIRGRGDIDIYCVLEDTHSIFGSSAKSNFTFGWINGILEGIVVSLAIPYTRVSPKKWQKEMWEGVRVVMNGRKVNTKATSLLAAKRLFPLEKFLATDKSRVPHDGIVDAMLLCEYCKHNF